MTPAEFRALASARIEYHKQQRDILDALNARSCQIAAAVAGVEDSKMSDYTIFAEIKEPEQTPEQWNRALEAWGIIGGL
jgi:hypothetical protein